MLSGWMLASVGYSWFFGSICLRPFGGCLLVLKRYQFTQNAIFKLHDAGWLFLFCFNVLSMIQAVCVTLAAVCWWLRTITFHKLFLNFVLWGWLAVSVCHVLFVYDPSCMCHSGSCLLVLKSNQYTHKFISKFQFIKLGGCFWWPHIVFSLAHYVFCHRGSCLRVFKRYQFTENPIFKFQFMRLATCCCLSCIVFSMLQIVCVTLDIVCWCLRATSLHTMPISNFILWCWPAVCVCHVLFSLWFNASVSLWQLSAGG